MRTYMVVVRNHDIMTLRISRCIFDSYTLTDDGSMHSYRLCFLVKQPAHISIHINYVYSSGNIYVHISINLRSFPVHKLKYAACERRERLVYITKSYSYSASQVSYISPFHVIVNRLFVPFKMFGLLLHLE